MRANLFASLLLAIVLVVVLAAPAAACPFCEGGPTGKNEAKLAIFGDHFWLSLGAVTLPFLLMFATTLVVCGFPVLPRSKSITVKPEGRSP